MLYKYSSCDYCGEAKPSRKMGKSGNFQSIYLCQTCNTKYSEDIKQAYRADKNIKTRAEYRALLKK